MRRQAMIAALVIALGAVPALASTTEPPLPFDLSGCRIADAPNGAAEYDAQCFFDALVRRYRGLTTYRDVARVTQVTHRAGEAPQRTVTRIGCEIEDGRLRVQTPSSRVSSDLGLDAMQPSTPQLEQALLQYRLWLAPHMGLKYTAEPDAGIRDGLKVTKVSESEKHMVRVEMQSDDGTPEVCSSRVDLYVNLDSLLVERMESEERMPDGASCATTMEITPLDTGAKEPAGSAAAPVDAAPAAPAVSGAAPPDSAGGSTGGDAPAQPPAGGTPPANPPAPVPVAPQPEPGAPPQR
jgi:hypothetical protein